MYSAITNNDADEIIATDMKQDGTKVSTGRRGIVSCELMVDELLQCKAKFCVLWAVLFKKELLDSCPMPGFHQICRRYIHADKMFDEITKSIFY